MNWQTKQIIQNLREETASSGSAFTPEQMAVLKNMIDRFEEALDRESSLLSGSINYAM